MKRFVLLTASALPLLALAPPAGADVTVEQTLDVTAPGALSLAAMQGKTVTAIAGDRSRTDNDLEFKSSLMQRFGGGAGQTTEIVRLDEDRVYSLDHEAREYRVTTFDMLKARTTEALGQSGQESEAAGADAPAGSTDLPVSEEECEWGETVVDVSRPGTRETIAGVEATPTNVTATRTCRDPQSGKACDLHWTMESWLAPEVPGGDEAIGFWRNYAGKLGFEDVAANAARPGMAALFSQYASGWEEIQSQAGDLSGFPMRTVMSLAIGGAECTTDAGEPISSEAVFGDAMQDAMGESAAESVGESVGGSVGGALAKGLFGAFGKKAKDDAPEPAPAATGAPGPVTLFKVVTETTSIDTGAVPAEEFAIPDGYREVSSVAAP